MSEDTSTWRTPEIEEGSNLYVIHPISAFLVKWFACWGVSPNTVSIFGTLSAFCAAACFYNYHIWYMSLLGFLFMLGWHILDGADGQLARRTGKTTEFGKFLDGLCDQLGFLSVYAAIALALQPEYGPWVWLLCFFAAFSHLAQAVSLEFQRDMYDCWVHEKHGKCVVSLDHLRENRDQTTGMHRAMATGFIFYTGLQHRVAELSHELLALEHKTRAHSQQRSRLGDLYRVYNLESVRRWTWLSANKRTVAIALSCLLQLPVLFFIYEFLILNAVLWWLKKRQKNINAMLAKTMLAVCPRNNPGEQSPASNPRPLRGAPGAGKELF